MLRYFLFIILFSTYCSDSLAETKLNFISDRSQVVDAGYVRLEWANPQNAEVELQQSTHADFTDARTRYRGTGHALFISGLANGDYRFRIGTDNDGWSEPILVSVRHQSLQRALQFLAIGALTAVATMLVIVKGARDDP